MESDWGQLGVANYVENSVRCDVVFKLHFIANLLLTASKMVWIIGGYLMRLFLLLPVGQADLLLLLDFYQLQDCVR